MADDKMHKTQNVLEAPKTWKLRKYLKLGEQKNMYKFREESDKIFEWTLNDKDLYLIN